MCHFFCTFAQKSKKKVKYVGKNRESDLSE